MDCRKHLKDAVDNADKEKRFAEIRGEVVHIDFGIVYEQGKGLGTPETVPFRLTQDMVDGMGLSGCEGTFRRSCEELLR
eukprot:gene37008-biopygen24385